MNGDQLRVFIVDDDEDDLDLLSEAFRESGFASEIKCFTSGGELLDLMALRLIEIPDIIVLDHYLSLKDETDMAKVIRNDKANDAITVVVYSSFLSPIAKEQLLQHGVDACRQKASNVDQLKEDVEWFCNAVKNKKRQ